MLITTLKEAFDLLSTAKCQLDFDDYVNMFGEQAHHIWNQEGNDLLRLWRSGLTNEQKHMLAEYITLKEFKPMPK